MEKEIAKTVIGNRHFEMPDSRRQHDWKNGMDWQQYHEEVYDAIVPPLNSMALLINSLVEVADPDDKQEMEWAKNRLWEATDVFIMILSSISPMLGNLYDMTAYSEAQAKLKEID